MTAENANFDRFKKIAEQIARKNTGKTPDQQSSAEKVESFVVLLKRLLNVSSSKEAQQKASEPWYKKLFSKKREDIREAQQKARERVIIKTKEEAKEVFTPEVEGKLKKDADYKPKSWMPKKDTAPAEFHEPTSDIVKPMHYEFAFSHDSYDSPQALWQRLYEYHHALPWKEMTDDEIREARKYFDAGFKRVRELAKDRQFKFNIREGENIEFALSRGEKLDFDLYRSRRVAENKPSDSKFVLERRANFDRHLKEVQTRIDATTFANLDEEKKVLQDIKRGIGERIVDDKLPETQKDKKPAYNASDVEEFDELIAKRLQEIDKINQSSKSPDSQQYDGWNPLPTELEQLQETSKTVDSIFGNAPFDSSLQGLHFSESDQVLLHRLKRMFSLDNGGPGGYKSETAAQGQNIVRELLKRHGMDPEKSGFLMDMQTKIEQEIRKIESAFDQPDRFRLSPQLLADMQKDMGGTMEKFFNKLMTRIVQNPEAPDINALYSQMELLEIYLFSPESETFRARQLDIRVAEIRADAAASGKSETLENTIRQLQELRAKFQEKSPKQIEKYADDIATRFTAVKLMQDFKTTGSYADKPFQEKIARVQESFYNALGASYGHEVGFTASLMESLYQAEAADDVGGTVIDASSEERIRQRVKELLRENPEVRARLERYVKGEDFKENPLSKEPNAFLPNAEPLNEATYETMLDNVTHMAAMYNRVHGRHEQYRLYGLDPTEAAATGEKSEDWSIMSPLSTRKFLTFMTTRAMPTNSAGQEGLDVATRETYARLGMEITGVKGYSWALKDTERLMGMYERFDKLSEREKKHLMGEIRFCYQFDSSVAEGQLPPTESGAFKQWAEKNLRPEKLQGRVELRNGAVFIQSIMCRSYNDNSASFWRGEVESGAMNRLEAFINYANQQYGREKIDMKGFYRIKDRIRAAKGEMIALVSGGEHKATAKYKAQLEEDAKYDPFMLGRAMFMNDSESVRGWLKQYQVNGEPLSAILERDQITHRGLHEKFLMNVGLCGSLNYEAGLTENQQKIALEYFSARYGKNGQAQMDAYFARAKKMVHFLLHDSGQPRIHTSYGEKGLFKGVTKTWNAFKDKVAPLEHVHNGHNQSGVEEMVAIPKYAVTFFEGFGDDVAMLRGVLEKPEVLFAQLDPENKLNLQIGANSKNISDTPNVIQRLTQYGGEGSQGPNKRRWGDVGRLAELGNLWRPLWDKSQPQEAQKARLTFYQTIADQAGSDLGAMALLVHLGVEQRMMRLKPSWYPFGMMMETMEHANIASDHGLHLSAKHGIKALSADELFENFHAEIGGPNGPKEIATSNPSLHAFELQVMRFVGTTQWWNPDSLLSRITHQNHTLAHIHHKGVELLSKYLPSRVVGAMVVYGVPGVIILGALAYAATELAQKKASSGGGGEHH